MATVNAENMTAFAQGLPCPHPEWTYGMMLMNSVGILGLTIDMFLFSKSKRYKTLSKVALPTSIFGITEPIIFGTPMILNVALAIPFILSPAICILLTKLVCSIGLVAMPTGVAAIAFMPLPFAMSLLNSSWTGFVWGLVLIVIMAAMFLPFFKYIDLKEYENEQKLETEEAVAAE